MLSRAPPQSCSASFARLSGSANVAPGSAIRAPGPSPRPSHPPGPRRAVRFEPVVHGNCGRRGSTPTPIVFYGRGYGHGVGMSQYGARGRAPRRPGRSHDPGPLLPGHDARHDRSEATRPDPRPARLPVVRDQAAPTVRARRTVDDRRHRRHVPARRPAPGEDRRDRLPGHGPRRRRQVAARPTDQGQPAGPGGQRRRCTHPGLVQARLVRPLSRGHQAALDRLGHRRDQRDRARPVPARRRAGRDAGRLAGRGAPGAGDRRPQLRRPPAPSQDRLLRPLRRHADPGLPRVGGRAGDDQRRGGRYRGPRPPERDLDRQHALPLDRRRRHRGQRERVHLEPPARSSPGRSPTCAARRTERPTARRTTPARREPAGRRRPIRWTPCRRSSGRIRGPGWER